jgi:catechol 2,3-dioxygenase-like lactoylglutathione lyase family enzyme
MRPSVRAVAVVACVVACMAVSTPALAQLAAPNAAGVTMGHLHYRVRDVAANTRFWVALGGRATAAGSESHVALSGVVVVLSQGESSGGTEGAVLNHVAFRVPSFKQVEAAGLKVALVAGFPGVGSTNTPEGERIELFEDAALNLGFVPDPRPLSPEDTARVSRHSKPVTATIQFHHIHLYVPPGQVERVKAWYAQAFGGVTGKRSNYDAVDLPGVNLNFSSVADRLPAGQPVPTPAPTRGRMLDHVGFEVKDLEATRRRLESLGVHFDQRDAKDPATGASVARFTDPWGVSIELTEGLAR